MPKRGDRIIIEGSKLGQVRREGQLLETMGSLMKVRWSDGSESLLTPGAGTVSVVPARSPRSSAAGGSKTAGKRAGGTNRKAAPRKTTPRAAAKTKAKTKKKRS